MVDSESGEVIRGGGSPHLKFLDDPDLPGETHIVELTDSGSLYEKLDRPFLLVSEGLRCQVTSTSETTSTLHVAAFH
jgi:hypothetical protein